MYFHCPPQFIERPQLLIDALAAHEVDVKFDSSTQGVGAIDLEPLGESDRYESFGLALRKNRFCANLAVYDTGGPESPLMARLVEVFTALGIATVRSPVEEELQFVESRFGGDAKVDSLIAEVREKQQRLKKFLNEQAFEQAARIADQRNTLLDKLHKSCIA